MSEFSPIYSRTIRSSRNSPNHCACNHDSLLVKEGKERGQREQISVFKVFQTPLSLIQLRNNQEGQIHSVSLSEF